MITKEITQKQTPNKNYPEYTSVRNADKYEEHQNDVIENIKLNNQLKNEFLKYKINVIKNADTKDPAAIRAVAELMGNTSNVVL